MEALIIWALQAILNGKDNLYSNDKSHVLGLYKRIEGLSCEKQDWKNAYLREKRQSDHKSRRIESMYRGEIIKLKSKKNE